jgi:hypothetical protein
MASPRDTWPVLGLGGRDRLTQALSITRVHRRPAKVPPGFVVRQHYFATEQPGHVRHGETEEPRWHGERRRRTDQCGCFRDYFSKAGGTLVDMS